MSDFDMGSSSSGMLDSSKRAQLMDQVKSQIAVAAAQELLQVSNHVSFFTLILTNRNSQKFVLKSKDSQQ